MDEEKWLKDGINAGPRREAQRWLGRQRYVVHRRDATDRGRDINTSNADITSSDSALSLKFHNSIEHPA